MLFLRQSLPFLVDWHQGRSTIKIMSKFTCVFLCAVAVISRVYAVSEEDKASFLDAIKPVIAECSQAHGVSEDDIKAAKEDKSSAGLEACFLGCVFKKSEVINDKGLFDIDAGLGKLAKLIKNKDDFNKLEEIGKKCVSVNEEPVSDGEAGCDRAKLLMSCFQQYKGEVAL